jgi:drug/metabolite transporter (DMT)-like permease
LVIVLLPFLLDRWVAARRPGRILPGGSWAETRRTAIPWVILNGLAGPTVGVGLYQWALRSTPSGLVLPITATTPLLVIPFTYWLDGDRPSRRSLAGGLVAVLGVVALAASMT